MATDLVDASLRRRYTACAVVQAARAH